MTNTTKTLLIIVVTAGLLVGGYLLVNQDTAPEAPTQDTATSTEEATSSDPAATGTDSATGSVQRIKNRRGIEISDQLDISEREEVPSDVQNALEGWLNDWKTVRSDLSFDGFVLGSKEKFAFPFNEVILRPRHENLESFEEANVSSPNGDMHLNYLYNYGQDSFSGVVLRNPEGNNELFRVAYCGDYCRYHFADWMSDNKFVTAAILEDARACEEGVPWEECPETLAFDVYDLDTMMVQHYTYKEALGDLKSHFPDVICENYPPCES